jgi:hypothetical protein
LANHVHFSSPEINRLSAQDPLEVTVRGFLQTARPRDSFVWTPEIVETEIGRICEFLDSIPERHTESGEASVSNNLRDLPMASRCGQPFEAHYLAARGFLYLGHIHKPYSGEGAFISPFFVQRDIFLAFFGDMTLHLQPAEVPLPPSQPPSNPPSRPSTPPEPNRFVAAKGSVSMSAQRERDMQELIEYFYPGTNANSLLLDWPYQ